MPICLKLRVSGITLDFVKLLLAKGTSVLVGDLALRPEAEEVAAKYPAGGVVSFTFHKTDVSSWPDLASLWKKALEIFPQVDLVVPGAGVYEPDTSSFWLAPGVDGSPSTDDANSEAGTYKTFGINLMHPIRLAQHALSYWTQKKIKGDILFLGSIAGYTATVGTPFYYSSKHGLHGFVRSLAPIRGRLGIRVSCVAPGATRVSDKISQLRSYKVDANTLTDSPLGLTPLQRQAHLQGPSTHFRLRCPGDARRSRGR